MPSLPGLTQQAAPPPLGMACSVAREQGDLPKHEGKLCDGQWLLSSAALSFQQQHFLPAECWFPHFLPSQGSHGFIESIDISNTEPSKHRLSSPTGLIWAGTKMHIYLILLHLEHSNSYCTRHFQPNPSGFKEMWCPLLSSPCPAVCLQTVGKAKAHFRCTFLQVTSPARAQLLCQELCMITEQWSWVDLSTESCPKQWHSTGLK